MIKSKIYTLYPSINFIKNWSGKALYEALGTWLWRWSVSHHILLSGVMSCVRQTFSTKSPIAFSSVASNRTEACIPTKQKSR